MKGLNQNFQQIIATSEQLFIGASVAVGMSAAITLPATAAGLTGAMPIGNDYYLYDVNGSQTYLNPSASLDSILQGNSSNPGGNIELFASSEKESGIAAFKSGQTTSISGKIGGQTLTLSSLNANDWFWDGSNINKNYGANNFANKWFNEFWDKGATETVKTNGVTIQKNVTAQTKFGLKTQKINVSLNAAESRAFAFDQFNLIGGFARSSDPNISYIYQDNSDINIGLAGHYDLKAFYTQDSQYAWLAPYLVNGFQASEVVKYSYGDTTDYLYSFNATKSGLLETDGWSHNGNYEVKIAGAVQSKDVPEPITGLVAAAGLGGAALRRMKKSQKS
jgi:hypothetical protein